MRVKQSCTVGTDFIGLPDDEVQTEWYGGKDSIGKWCSYFSQVDDDTDHPSVRLRVCGNCTHYIVIEDMVAERE